MANVTIMAKRVKRHKRDGCSEDRISELSNDILAGILSQLTTKEAVRTCVLSHRWEKLWTLITSSLSFDGSGWMLRAWKFGESRTRLKKCAFDMERANFVSCVNHVLEVHQGPTVEELSIRCNLDRRSTADIDSWVYFAIEKGVQRLNLELSNHEVAPLKHRYYFPSLQLLHTHATGFASFNSLKTLSLIRVNVNGQLLEYFLSSNPFLEKLSVVGSYSLVNLRVAGPSLKLRHLQISNCFRMEKIEMSATDLVYFKYCGRRISLAFENVPKLVEICFKGYYCKSMMDHMWNHSSYLSRLETLTLDMACVKYKRFWEFPPLVNLKQLVLIVTASEHHSLLPYSHFLKAAPFMHTFVLQLKKYGRSIQREVAKFTKYHHQELKVVELIGFIGRTIDVEFALHLLEIAISLEKIIIDPRERLQPSEVKEKVEIIGAREEAKKLEEMLPAGAELVIL